MHPYYCDGCGRDHDADEAPYTIVDGEQFCCDTVPDEDGSLDFQERMEVEGVEELHREGGDSNEELQTQ